MKTHIKISLSGYLTLVLVAVGMYAAKPVHAQGYCPQAQSQCGTQINTYWSCVQNNCPNNALYVFCEASVQPCLVDNTTANDCIYQACGYGSGGSSTGGGGSVGHSNVPWYVNGVSAQADFPPVTPPVVKFSPGSGRGPLYNNNTEGDTSNRVNEWANTYMVGAGTDYLWDDTDPNTYKKIGDMVIKPCLQASQAMQNYYDNTVTPKLLAFRTFKFDEGDNGVTEWDSSGYPSFSDCDVVRCRSGFTSYCP